MCCQGLEIIPTSLQKCPILLQQTKFENVSVVSQKYLVLLLQARQQMVLMSRQKHLALLATGKAGCLPVVLSKGFVVSPYMSSFVVTNAGGNRFVASQTYLGLMFQMLPEIVQTSAQKVVVVVSPNTAGNSPDMLSKLKKGKK